ncbi:MAG: hypothetical protein WCS37_22115 [Chloroflexota bacterium]|nr:hypothetical protein [Chloroflexota bacterium]
MNNPHARTLENKPSLPIFILVGTLLISLALGACGDSVTTSKSNTPATSPTIAPSPTTPPTVVPSPTPEPKPNKLLLGSENAPWGEVTRYQSATTDHLQELNLNEENRTNLSSMFAAAPELAAIGETAATTLKSGTYALSLKPELVKGLNDGTLQFMKSLEGGIRPVVVDSKGVIQGMASVKLVGGALTLAAAGPMVFKVLAVVVSAEYLAEINKQLEAINKSVNEIKEFLEADKRSQLEGDLKYLNAVGDLLNQQKIAPNDVETFRNQLEGVERETLQIAYLLRSLMEKADKNFAEVNLDKTLFIFRNEDKVNELKNLLTDHKRQAANYFTALSVRGLASQVRCAMPESRTIALARLEDDQKELSAWYQTQTKFYDLVESRVSEMDGLFSDSKTRDQFTEQAKVGRQDSNQNYTQLDGLLSATIQKAKAQNQTTDQPLNLVVTMDESGKIVKVSKLLS